MQAVFEDKRRPQGVVQVSLPGNTRGESVPIVHCVRHRRSLHAADQYAGTQQNMNQEYINLTRGVEKTCMWVEMQPFGYPGKPWDAHHHHAEGCSCDEHCCDYAMRRNKHIRDYKLQWCLLEEHKNVSSSYYECLHEGIGEMSANNLHILADKIWWKLHRKEIQDLPHLGKDSSDFKSFQEVLHQGTGMSASVARFACASTRSLRDVIPSSAARRCTVSEILKWKAAMKFGHLLLPCATAEISSQADKGVTRLCLPFMHASGGLLDPEDAIASLCGLAWFLAFLLERDLVATGRLWRVSHKMCSTKEDDDLWFNKPCTCGRLATAIEDGTNTMLYMYIGGSAATRPLEYVRSVDKQPSEDMQW